MTETAPWWSDHRNLAMTAEFIRRQADANDIDLNLTLDIIVGMLGQPDKHDDDYNLAAAEDALPTDLQASS